MNAPRPLRSIWLVSADHARPLALAERLKRQGLAADVLVFGPTAPPPARHVPGLRSAWSRPFAVRSLMRSASAERPDLLHLIGPETEAVGLALADAWSLPYVREVADFPAFGDRLRIARRFCRALIVPGADVAQDLTRSMRVPGDLIHVVEPGIEVGPPCNHDTSPRVPVVGAAASDSGLSVFLAAAARLLDNVPDVEFVVAGGGERTDHLRRLASHLDIAERTTFVGQAAPGPSFWRVIDVLCVTANGPDAGLVLARALGLGLPAVASNVPGLRGWVEHRATGLLVPPGDSERLAGALSRLLADQDGARAMGAAARRRIQERCDPEREAATLAALYHYALEDRAPRRPAWRVAS